jgi:hypothetical protein
LVLLDQVPVTACCSRLSQPVEFPSAPVAGGTDPPPLARVVLARNYRVRRIPLRIIRCAALAPPMAASPPPPLPRGCHDAAEYSGPHRHSPVPGGTTRPARAVRKHSANSRKSASRHRFWRSARNKFESLRAYRFSRACGTGPGPTGKAVGGAAVCGTGQGPPARPSGGPQSTDRLARRGQRSGSQRSRHMHAAPLLACHPAQGVMPAGGLRPPR